jgi:hypothetical protein
MPSAPSPTFGFLLLGSGAALPALGLMFLGSLCFGSALLWAWWQRRERIAGVLAALVAGTYFVWGWVIAIVLMNIAYAFLGPPPVTGTTFWRGVAQKLVVACSLVLIPGCIASACAWAVTSSARVTRGVLCAGVLASVLFFIGAVSEPWIAVIALPVWCVISCGAVLAWTIQRRRPPTDPDLCKRCGYDARGLRGRCPECGESIVPA